MKKSQIKESDITIAIKVIVEHVRDQVKNSIIEAHNRSIVKGLEDSQIKTICNIIDTSTASASTNAIGSEARGLIKKIHKDFNRA